MSRPAHLLAMTVVVCSLLATAGCIEVKDRPESGEFVIEVDSAPLHFVPDEGGELHGPHAHVETDLHHEHPDYAWDIEDVGEFEGSKIDLPATEVGIRRAVYNLTYYEQGRDMGLLVTTIPSLSGIYFVVGNGTGLEGHANTSVHPVFVLDIGPGLETIHEDANGSVMEFSGRLSEGMAVNISLGDVGDPAASYVVAVHLSSGDLQLETSGSIVIYPNETHRLLFVDDVLNVTIIDREDPGNITYHGNLGHLPEAYRTHIGQLEWEGTVGEVEAPGMAGWGAVLALTVVTFVVTRRRR